MPGVEEYDVSSDNAPQLGVYNLAVKMLPKNSWVLFIDIDEYLQLETCSTVKDFLDSFTDADVVRLNWKCFGDCDQLHYSPEPVTERFKTPLPKDFIYNNTLPYGYTENCHVKSFLYLSDKEAFMNVHNAIVKYGKAVNAKHQEQDMFSPWQDICWEGAWINHYQTKSTEEFAKRRFKTTDATGNKIQENKLISWYFNANKKTPEKEAIFNDYLK